MTVPTLLTYRLALRGPQARDARAVTKALNNLNISRWLTVVPFPYGMTDAQWFINETLRGHIKAWFMWVDDALVGTIGLGGKLGYWLAEPAHHAIAQAFRHYDCSIVYASAWEANTSSAAVLRIPIGRPVTRAVP